MLANLLRISSIDRVGSSRASDEGGPQNGLSLQTVLVLTPREREVLRLLADGMRNEEIGRELQISPDTVRAHVRKAMARLDADTRTEAVATALRQQLIS